MGKKEIREWFCSDCWQVLTDKSIQPFGEHEVEECEAEESCGDADHWILEGFGHKECPITFSDGTSASRITGSVAETKHLLAELRSLKQENKELFGKLVKACKHPKLKGKRCAYCHKELKVRGVKA